MGHHELQYPKDAQNLVKRHGERGVYALEQIHSIINSSQILHVSFNTPNSLFPVTLPMIGQMGSFDRPSASTGDPLDLYLHGYVSARIMNLSRSSSTTTTTSTSQAASDGQEREEEEEEEKPAGLPVCVAASHLDGLVLGLSSFNHSYNYRSAVLFGHAALVQDPQEKAYALELITNGVVPDRWRHTRLPPTAAELQSTSVLRVRVASGSAKVRDGGTGDGGADVASEEVLGEVWAGMLPVYQTVGEPLPASYNRVGLPAHVADFVKDFNNDNEEYATAAAKK